MLYPKYRYNAEMGLLFDSLVGDNPYESFYGQKIVSDLSDWQLEDIVIINSLF